MITQSMKEEIIKEYLENKKSFMSLAKEFGINRMTIANIVKDVGIKTAYFVDLDEQEIANRYLAGISAEQIARDIGISNSPVNKILRKKGITKRDRSTCHLGQKPWNKGKKWPIEMKEKLSQLSIGKRIGNLNGNWKGGRPNKSDRRRNWLMVKEWKRLCLLRDGKCLWCKSGNKLEVHHIVPLRKAKDIVLLGDMGNGITLCRNCHKKVLWHEHEYEDFFCKLLKTA